MNERNAAKGVAKAEADFQLSRPFASGLRRTMNGAQLATIRALVFNGVLAGIEAWEKGRASREAAAFYEGKADPLAPLPLAGEATSEDSVSR